MAQHWYLLYCKAKEEEKAVLHLANQGVMAFYPKGKFAKIVRGTRKQVIEALFPNYVFVHLDDTADNFVAIRSTRGVLGFVKQGMYPQKVPESIITALRQLDGGEQISPNTAKAGDKVTIKSGAFANIQAIYQEPVGEKRALLLVELMHKPAVIEVENSQFSMESKA